MRSEEKLYSKETCIIFIQPATIEYFFIPGTVLGAWNITVKKRIVKLLTSLTIIILQGVG